NTIQVVTDIDANRSDRRGVTQSETDGVGVVRHDVSEANVVVDIPAVVEDRETEILLDGQRKSKFRVQNKQLFATGRNADETARRRIRRIAARGNGDLRTRAIQWKAA